MENLVFWARERQVEVTNSLRLENPIVREPDPDCRLTCGNSGWPTAYRR